MHSSVIIVDDEPAMCEVIASKLAKTGWNVRWFTSADKALNEIQSDGVDVVLTDLNMPGTNGIEFCSRLAQAHQY